MVEYIASENVAPIFTTFISNGGGRNIFCQDKVLLLNCTGRMRAVLGSIYTEQKRTRKVKLQLGFSKNPSGSDVTFAIGTNVISTIGVKGFFPSNFTSVFLLWGFQFQFDSPVDQSNMRDGALYLPKIPP